MPSLSSPAAGASRAHPSSRVPFIDLARASAVLFMIQGHALNVLLQPGSWQDNPVFGAWLYLRGLTSCLFFLLSGFVFSVATDRHWDSHLRVTRPVVRRLFRFALFLVLGYAMHFPMGRFEHLEFANEERWRSFLAVDVLQVVAATLILLQLLVMATRTRRRFTAAALALCVAVVVLTPIAWSIDWTEKLPLVASSYVTSATGSLFPMLPWAAYVLLGAAIGMGYARRGATRDISETSRIMLRSGVVLLACSLVLHQIPFNLYSSSDFWTTSPNSFLLRSGSVLIILGAIAALSSRVRHLPVVLRALAQESLMIYVVHVAIIYGSLWNRGMRQLVGPQGLLATIGWILALFVAMGLLAFGWNRAKRFHPLVAHAVRAMIAVVLVWPLL